MNQEQGKQSKRVTEWSRLPKITLPKEISKTAIKDLFDKGMIPKVELKDQAYYLGTCRNAMVARWSTEIEKFTYMRTKFTNVYPENICHPEDDNGFDLFIPFKRVSPFNEEIIGKDTRNFITMKSKSK